MLIWKSKSAREAEEQTARWNEEDRQANRVRAKNLREFADELLSRAPKGRHGEHAAIVVTEAELYRVKAMADTLWRNI